MAKYLPLRMYSKALLVWALMLCSVTFVTDLYGQNWSLKTPINAAVDFNGVHFTNDQTGYAVGSGGAIYKTIDGGLSWNAQSSGTTEIFYGVFFVDATTGYAVGANGTIRKTLNGGANWNTQTAAGTATTIFYGVHFPDPAAPGSGFIVGSGGKIIKTTNGGTAWSTLTSGTTNDLLGVYFTSATVGYAAGSAGKILKTTNGTNWAPLTIGTTQNINDIFFANANTGYTAGGGGEIWKTIDAGVTWINTTSNGLGIQVFSLHFTDALTGYVSSSSSYTEVTVDGASNWISYQFQSPYSTLNDIHFSSPSTGYMVGTTGALVKYQSAIEPEYQGSNMAFTEVFANSLRVTFNQSPDLPAGYIAVRKVGSVPSTAPMDGITYTIGQTLGDGIVEYIGSSTSFGEASLTPGTNYYYAIYAYNGSGTAINYKVDSPLQGNQSTYVTGQPWTDLTGSIFYQPRDVHFFDANNGGTGGGYFLETTANGGQSWTNGFSGNGDGYYGVFFISASTGYIVGSGNGSARIIRRTLNGGATWVDQVRTTSTYGLNDVWFSTPTTGFAVGGGGNMLRTTTGTTWSPVTTGTTNSLNGVNFPSSATGYAVGQIGTVIKTINAGTSWSTQITGTTNELTDVFFIDDNVGFAVGFLGTILKTINGGVIWNSQVSGTTTQLNGVHFVDANTGYAVGLAGTLLKTINGGTDWYPFPTGITVDLHGIYFPTPHTGYAVGERIFKYQSVPEPTGQPSSISFASIQSQSATISFSPAGGSPTGYLALRKIGSAPTAMPLDGVAYVIDGIIGDGTVAYVGTNVSFADVSLATSTDYFYTIYSYNSSGESGSINYYLTSPLTGDFFTLATKPASQPTTLVFNNITSSSFTLSYTAAAGPPTGYIVVRKAGSLPTSNPVDGTSYTASQTIGDGVVAYSGSAVSFGETSLSSGSNYFYKIYSYNGSGPSTNYFTASPLTGNIDFGIPTISSFVPSGGPIGTSVTITGTNFSTTLAANIVYFGATKAMVTAATGTQLTVNAPIGTTYQPISVTLATSGLTAFSKNPFVVTFPSSGVGIDISSFTTDNIDFGTEDTPTNVEINDMDGDGKPDMIVTAVGNSTISIFRNTGAPASPASFAPRTDIITGSSYLYGLAVGDLDGDGKPDIVVTNLFANSISLFRNTSTSGSISFAPKVDFLTNSYPYAVAIGDLNADGRPDLAVPNYNSDNVSILRNISTLGNIGMAAKVDFAVGSLPDNVAIKDIDGDGKNDLAVTNNTGASVSILRNTTAGSISFAGKIDFTVGTNPESVAFADLDGDGKPDMAVANGVSSTISVFRNTASSGTINSGSFAAKVDLATGFGPNNVVIADIDGDGKADVAVSNANVLANSISIFRNTSTSGSITLTPKVDVGTGSTPSGLAIGDMDGDGKPDMVVSSQSGNVAVVHRNLIAGPVISSFAPLSGPVGSEVAINGSGFSTVPVNNIVFLGGVRATVTNATPTLLTVAIPTGTTYQPITVTLNGLTASSSSSFIVTFNSSLAIDVNSFAPKADFATGTTPVGVAMGDIDGDGKADVAVINNASNTVSVFRNTSVPGTVSYAAPVSLTVTSPNGIALGDLDGDGKLDLIASNTTGSQASVFRNISTSGSISFSTKVDFATASSPYGVAIGDIDLDGKLDFAVTCFFSNKVSVFRNVSAVGTISVSSFNAKVDFTTGSGPTSIAIGDLNGDGKADLAVTNNSGNTISVLKNTSTVGTISLAAKADFSTGGTSAPYVVAIGDLNADGKQELVTANSNNATVSVFKNQTLAGSISFATRADFATGTGAYGVAIGDLDGDGSPDLATANVSAGTSSVLKNTSTGSITFASKFDMVIGAQPRAIVVGDVDGDGKPELNVVSGSSATLSTVRNTNVLNAPTAGAASVIAQTSFTANWSAIPAATDYRLDVSVDNFVSFLPGYNSLVVAGTSQTITGLTVGTSHKYRIRANNASGVSANSGPTTVLTLPATPVATMATTLLQTGFTANWAAASGAVDYRLDVSISNTFATRVSGYDNLTVSATTKAVTGLTPGTTYYYRVRAANATGSSSDSNSITVLLLPPDPVASTATNILTTGFTTNWSASTSAASYLLDISTNSGFSSYIAGYLDASVTGTSSVITGLTAGTTYYFRLRALNASGNSLESNQIAVITLSSAPIANAATSVSPAAFTANWSSVTGAADYRIDISTDNAFGSFVGSYNNFTVAGTSVAVSGLASGTTYYYRVRASNASGFSANSGTTTVLTFPVAPVANAATAVTSTTFTASWNAITSATGYFLDVSSDNFATTISGYGNLSISGSFSITLSVTVPSAGVTYKYRVRAVNTSGTSTDSNIISVLVLPAAPVAASATAITDVSFSASWGAITGATEYNLDVSSNNFASNVTGFDNLIVPGTTISVTSLTPGTTYKYRLRAVNASGSSLNSNAITAITVSPAPIATNATAVSTTGFTATWAATQGAASYLLDVSTTNFSTFIPGYNPASITGTSTAISGLTAGTTYQYRVRAVNGSGTSINSNVISSITLPVAPTASASSTVTSSGFTASWSAVTGASDYRIDVATISDFSVFAGSYNNQTVGGTSIAVTGLVAGTTYYYRVRASNASGASSNSSTITTLLKPAPPNAIAATAVSVSGFTTNWSAVAGVSGYKLDVSVNDFVSNILGYDDLSVAGLSQVVTGLVAGTTYKYRVRSLNAAGASDNSNAIATITIPPAPVATPATSVSATGFTATWVNSGVTAYYLDVSTNGFSTYVSVYNNFSLSSSSQNISGLTAGTAYQYRVRAGNVSGTSVNSNTITVTTLPVAPSASAASSITSTGFTANWTTSPGATEYRVDVSTDNTFITFVGSYFNQQVAGTSLAVIGLNPGVNYFSFIQGNVAVILPGVNYFYRVRAGNASGSSASSGTIPVLTLPDAPTANAAASITSNSFVASWNSVPSATGYFIDVSTSIDNFTIFVSGYDNASVALTSVTVTVPTAGIDYKYRVRAIGPSGTSANSNVVTTLVKTSPPGASAATSITSGSFIANWSTVTNATGYYLDVSTNNFASFIPGYDNFLLNGISQNITGLTAGTNFQYRVRSYNNTGSSANSATIVTITIPPAPVTVSATAFTSTSFTANWLAATGAANYRLDISSDLSFGSFVSGFNDFTLSTTSLNVSGLSPGTVYYYRVRAVNASGASVNSNITTSTNVPPAPIASIPTSVSTTSFIANWSTTPGADTYFLDVSSTNFSTFVGVFNNFNVTGSSQTISGLSPGTEYQYRVRASNSSGTSVNSVAINSFTLSAAPVGTAASLFSTSGFTANWSSAISASSYLLDVSVDNFSTFVTGFNGTSVTGTSASVTGLNAGIAYQYRLLAVNSSGNSALSTPVSALTISPAPVVAPATLIGVNSFIANWSAALGASSYFIDVSMDGFSTFVAGFNNRLATGTSLEVLGLLPAKTYQYRVRSSNNSGNSPNSELINVTTLASEPTAQATAPVFSGITTAALKVAFTPASADGYLVVRKVGTSPAALPVDATTYSVGSVLDDAIVAYVGSLTNFNESGLAAGNKYFYVVFAYSGTGISTNYLTTAPLKASQITLSKAPVAAAATITGQTSFTANWASAIGASDYSIDVSSDGFTTFISGFNNQSTGNVITFNVTGLVAGTTYQYRIVAVNAAGKSAYSNVQTVLTIPATPSELTASLVTPSSFKLTWNAVVGFDNFFIDLSPDNFVTFTVNNVSIAGPTSFEFLGLSPATTYKVRLRSNNATGASPNSTVLTIATLASGGLAALRIETPVFVNKMLSTPVSVSVDVSGGSDPKVVKLRYRKITGLTFASILFSLKTAGIYDTSITPEMADDLGVEFYIEAGDAAGSTKESSVHYFIYRSIDASSNQSIPFTLGSFNGKAATYQMFSIPYILEDASISNLFDPALNGPDAIRWKLLHYQNGAYAGYPDQLKKIEPGKGYWFNTTQSDFQIKISQATVQTVSQTASFEMTLEKGWNQIGNPYPFNVNWDKIKESNTAAGLNSIWLFEEGSYLKKDVLATWKGAFVFSDNGGKITFPISSKTSAPGRVADDFNPSIDDENWQVPIALKVGGIQTVSSIGMHTGASSSKDKYDEIAVPRFHDFVEMKTKHPEFFAPDFSTDIVPSGKEHDWSFDVESTLDGSAQLSWDHRSLSNQKSGLYLVDIANQVWIDMKLMGNYTFELKDKHQIKIMYNKEGYINPGFTLIGHAYPNPFTNKVTVPVIIGEDRTSAELQIFDMMGKPVKTIREFFEKKGLYQMDWNNQGDEVESGVLLYRVMVNDQLTKMRRIVKVK